MSRIYNAYSNRQEKLSILQRSHFRICDELVQYNEIKTTADYNHYCYLKLR